MIASWNWVTFSGSYCATLEQDFSLKGRREIQPSERFIYALPNETHYPKCKGYFLLKRLHFPLHIFFFIFRVAPLAYGGFPDLGSYWGATAASLHPRHSNGGSGHVFDLHHCSRQYQILGIELKSSWIRVGFINH